MSVPERIELYYWEGCPSHPEALALLEDVLAEHGVTTEVELHEVQTDDEAAELRFPGSPTIRFDGRDVDPAGAEARPAADLPHLLPARRACFAGAEPGQLEEGYDMTIGDAAPQFALRRRRRAGAHA